MMYGRLTNVLCSAWPDLIEWVCLNVLNKWLDIPKILVHPVEVFNFVNRTCWHLKWFAWLLLHTCLFLLAARLMHKYNAHGATDVTGFGLLGHATNLARVQKNEVGFVIHNLPIIAKMAAVSKACGNMFGLLQGHSAETSGKLRKSKSRVPTRTEKMVRHFPVRKVREFWTDWKSQEKSHKLPENSRIWDKCYLFFSDMNYVLFAKMDQVFSQRKRNFKNIREKWEPCK